MRTLKQTKGVYTCIGDDGTEYLVTRDDEASDRNYLWRGFSYGDMPEIYRSTKREIVNEIRALHG